MDFSRKKLPKEAAMDLRICPIHTIKPYSIMLAPVYVFMKRNEKFVSVKAPLDFFSPEELDRLKPFESFFVPPFVDEVMPFRSAACVVKSLLRWEPQSKSKDQATLPPAPYELSDAVLRAVGPLWGKGAVIEPFFAAVFGYEICDTIDGERMRLAREKDVNAYENGILRSGLAVFLALHLGYCDLSFLTSLRARVFEATVAGGDYLRTGEVEELLDLVWRTMTDVKVTLIHEELFANSALRSAQKLSSRLSRVKQAMIREDAPVPTVFGLKGFVDV